MMNEKKWQCMGCDKWIAAHEGEAITKNLLGARVTFIACHECIPKMEKLIDNGVSFFNALSGNIQ